MRTRKRSNHPVVETSEVTVNPEVVTNQQLQLVEKLSELERNLEELKPKPPATVFCDVEQKTYLAHDVNGWSHLRKITFEGKPWGNACGPCTNHGVNTRLEDIADFLASRKLGFAKGTRLVDAGLVLLPYIQAKTPLSRISPEQLAHDFDRHPRFGNKPPKAMVPGTKRVVSTPAFSPTNGKQVGIDRKEVEDAKFVTHPNYDPDNPGRSQHRPLLPSERDAQLIEQLEAAFAAKVTQGDSRKGNLDRRIQSLQEQRRALDA